MIKIFSALFATVFAGVAFAQTVPALQTRIVATGLEQPLFATAPEGDSRLFIVEKGGLIKILENGAVLPTPFLDLSGSVDTRGERGLLGMTFDPNFGDNRRFYVNYIDKTTLNTVVATYQASTAQPNVADATSSQTVITIAQTGFSNHKAGWIGFRPGETGNLYIGTGDGGSRDDPDNRAQNLKDNLGKMLRVDVAADRFPNDTTQYGYAIPDGNLANGNPGINPEIYAYGLRNPYRDSFDRETGALYIADVGQDNREEINIGSAGANYGWRVFEGTGLNFPNDTQPSNHTPPIFEYDHNGLGASITGGYVYRGSLIDGLQGTYFFADFVTDHVMSFRFIGSGITDLTDRTAELLSPTGISGRISSFGEDGFGNLYLVSLNGQIGMITAIPEPESYAMMLAGMILIALWVRRRENMPGLILS
ncbi:putative secreted protein with PEP-CTERM sorting signal [Nitrosospira sp. Nsp5]|uniref:PEP-CTERM protein-sorting domain-containing protein n=1 Tax=Nitrosospira multiformis TaxID=1231 RepID=A0ABY0TAS2_9PROT|nr:MULTISPECIES: PQQ-dependent sugar dehydrogenase [Nitrosospira]PTR08398.1 putative secreted protein with PEP-CTERM sorting signal [Nitrosospira sp. Nsp5]SDQ54907.1 PEP-CTERM protein-sorting domain-containing protein [Nitrosospira multiformis]